MTRDEFLPGDRVVYLRRSLARVQDAQPLDVQQASSESTHAMRYVGHMGVAWAWEMQYVCMGVREAGLDEPQAVLYRSMGIGD